MSADAAKLKATAAYLRLGFALVPLEPGTKLPRTTDWQKNPITNFAMLGDTFGNGRGVGLHHGASGTAALDIDDLELARLALKAVSIDLDALLSAPGPKIDTSRSLKPLYRLPEGFAPSRHALSWKDADGKVHTVFELRSGLVQDVLPPTVHPDTHQPYGWNPAPPTRREDIPELPGSLATLWENWAELKPLMDEANPWAQPTARPSPPPPPRPKQTGERPEVIGRFNETHSIRELLEARGYIPKGNNRFLSPHSETGTPGVKLFQDGDTETVYSHHGSDPLGCEHSHDAFSVYCILEHNDDVNAAVRAAASLLGLTAAPPAKAERRPDQSEPPEEGWTDKLGLPVITPEVKTLPAEMLPEPLRPWIDDVAERLCVHREYVAIPALASLGAVVGRTVGIHPKQFDDWLEVPNLWGALIGPPSSKKSPSINEGSAPLDRLAAKAAEAHTQAQAERDANGEIIKLELETIKKRARAKGAEAANFRDELQTKLSELEQNDVPERRYLTNDGTIEKLAELLKATPRGLLVKRDELIGLLKTCDKSGHETDRAFYLEAWNGKGRHTIDRVGKGTFHIPALTLALLGGIQPGPLASYVKGAVEGEGGADGLLQRFQLLVWPDRQRPYVNVDRYADTAAKTRAFKIFEFLDTELEKEFPAKEDDPDSIPALRFSPQAQVLFNEWLETLMGRLLSPELEATPAFHAHLSKYPSLMPSLALLFHLVDVADGRPFGPVSADAADLAINWCDFLELHARKLYALELNSTVVSAHALAERIEQGEVKDNQNVSDLYRRRFPSLTTADEVNAALAILETCHWLRIQEVPNKGARPSRFVRLHPDFREGNVE